jgi:hypothetical protein
VAGAARHGSALGGGKGLGIGGNGEVLLNFNKEKYWERTVDVPSPLLISRWTRL